MYHITTLQMQCFLIVAERKNFTEAAKILFVSQSVVSKWIFQLETELNTQLFIRTKKGVALTPQGEYLAREWQGIFDGLCSSITEMNTIGKHDGILRIGCLDGHDYDNFLPELIKKYEKKYPETTVGVDVYGYRELREHLLNNALDLILTLSFELSVMSGVSHHVMQQLKLYIAVPADHPLAERESLHFRDLKDETICVLSPDESRMGSESVTHMCGIYGFTPKRIQFYPNLSSLAMAVKQGKGVSVCSDDIFKRNPHQIKFYPADYIPDIPKIILVWRSDESRSAVMHFIDLAKSQC